MLSVFFINHNNGHYRNFRVVLSGFVINLSGLFCLNAFKRF